MAAFTIELQMLSGPCKELDPAVWKPNVHAFARDFSYALNVITTSALYFNNCPMFKDSAAAMIPKPKSLVGF